MSLNIHIFYLSVNFCAPIKCKCLDKAWVVAINIFQMMSLTSHYSRAFFSILKWFYSAGYMDDTLRLILPPILTGLVSHFTNEGKGFRLSLKTCPTGRTLCVGLQHWAMRSELFEELLHEI